VIAAAAAAALAAALSMGPLGTPAAWGATTACPRTSGSASWSTALPRARTALDAAVTAVQHENHNRAIDRLRALKHWVRVAHTSATSLVGKPPTDPESDEPPGPNAVQRTAGVEHQVTLQLVPLFDHLRGRVVRPLGRSLTVADSCRRVMLNKVIALRPAARDDYTDGLSDTLPDYKKELTTLSAALRTGALTTRARTSLEHDRKIVTATRNAMQKTFGGGEKPPGRSAPRGSRA
jgi:hypothetical protein